MRRIVLISCVSKKLPTKARARDLYTSPLFKLSLSYAESLHPDRVFILSAKYGLLSLDRVIDPYNVTLLSMPKDQVLNWAKKVLAQLHRAVDLERDEIIFLCGGKYRKYLIPSVKHYQIPMQGLGIGRQLHYLKTRTAHD